MLHFQLSYIYRDAVIRGCGKRRQGFRVRLLLRILTYITSMMRNCNIDTDLAAWCCPGMIFSLMNLSSVLDSGFHSFIYNETIELHLSHSVASEKRFCQAKSNAESQVENMELGYWDTALHAFLASERGWLHVITVYNKANLCNLHRSNHTKLWFLHAKLALWLCKCFSSHTSSIVSMIQHPWRQLWWLFTSIYRLSGVAKAASRNLATAPRDAWDSVQTTAGAALDLALSPVDEVRISNPRWTENSSDGTVYRWDSCASGTGLMALDCTFTYKLHLVMEF